MKGYKAVWQPRGQREIYSWGSGMSGYRYEVGVPRVPDEGYGPMAVFDTLEHALEYLDSVSQIYECEYTPYRGKRKALWNPWIEYPLDKVREHCPGTRLASSVTLLRRVPKREIRQTMKAQVAK